MWVMQCSQGNLPFVFLQTVIKLSPSVHPVRSPVRCKILALIVLENPKFGESLSLDNIIFNVILFSNIKTTITQCTTEKKFILFPIQSKIRKIYHVLVLFVCVSSVTSGGVTDMFGLIAFKAKFTLVSSIQHHLLKIGK